MKRITALLLALCLLLCACGSQPEETQPVTEAPTEAPTEIVTEAPTEAPTEPATEAPAVIRHPLTGEVLESVFTGRPTALVINNISVAMPQSGISGADMLYEIETESGITRCLAIFTDFEGIGAIGPIRSARTYFNNIATSYNAPLFHCGGSPMAKAAQYDASGATLNNWVHVDQMANTQYFYRDQVRFNSGYAWEHTLYTTAENVLQCLADKELNTVNEAGTDYGFSFSEEPEISGNAANKVVMSFLGGKKTEFTYNAEAGLYDADQYGKDWLDAPAEKTLQFRNILALYAPQQKISDGWDTRSFYELVGSGTGYFACDGKIVKINWHREDLYGPFSYTLEDGTPLTLGVGKTYVGIASDRCDIDYE
ncbi:MAG: DUF3048 domain-containing protein [Oscillospiraceae bacterium]|nr:DUF3048 domain-containing protein [Oscillospiraceae bacterium]